MSRSKLRRGVLFGGFTLIMTIVIFPFAVNAIYGGPIGEIGIALVWVTIVALSAFAFYLGYTGWGEGR